MIILVWDLVEFNDAPKRSPELQQGRRVTQKTGPFCFWLLHPLKLLPIDMSVPNFAILFYLKALNCTMYIIVHCTS